MSIQDDKTAPSFRHSCKRNLFVNSGLLIEPLRSDKKKPVIPAYIKQESRSVSHSESETKNLMKSHSEFI